MKGRNCTNHEVVRYNWYIPVVSSHLQGRQMLKTQMEPDSGAKSRTESSSNVVRKRVQGTLRPGLEGECTGIHKKPLGRDRVDMDERGQDSQGEDDVKMVPLQNEVQWMATVMKEKSNTKTMMTVTTLTGMNGCT